MLLRLLALLITLGLCAGVVQASDLGTASTASLVEEAEDTPEPDVLVTSPLQIDVERTMDASTSIMLPLRAQHFLFVFRPPRVPAFN